MVARAKLVGAAALLVGLTGLGALGYRLIEGASWADSLYMSIITLSTVGFGEVFELSPVGRMFTAGLIVVGIGLVFGITGMWVRLLLEGGLEEALGQRRMSKALHDIQDHFIVCGYGEFGRRVVEQLLDRRERVVVIDNQAPVPDGVLSIRGDAGSDGPLLRAGVARARALIAVLPRDADNVYLTLTAKEMQPAIHVVARCSGPSSERKLRRAGASQVVSPYSVGATHLIELALNPSIVQFGELLGADSEKGLDVAEIEIGAGSRLDGGTLQDFRVVSRFGVIPVGLVTPERGLESGLEPDRELVAGEVLLCVGPRTAIERLAEACEAEPAE